MTKRCTENPENWPKKRTGQQACMRVLSHKHPLPHAATAQPVVSHSCKQDRDNSELQLGLAWEWSLTRERKECSYLSLSSGWTHYSFLHRWTKATGEQFRDGWWKAHWDTVTEQLQWHQILKEALQGAPTSNVGFNEHHLNKPHPKCGWQGSSNFQELSQLVEYLREQANTWGGEEKQRRKKQPHPELSTAPGPGGNLPLLPALDPRATLFLRSVYHWCTVSTMCQALCKVLSILDLI